MPTASKERPTSTQDNHTRRIALRPIAPEDVRFLYDLATHPDVSYRWRYRSGPPTLEQFHRELFSGVLSQFIVCSQETGAPVGHVAAFWADLKNGFTHAGIVCAPAVHATGLGVEATGKFLSHLFETWPLRKIYFETPGWNLPQFASGIGRLAVQEACLRQHEYFRGRYWDLVILALYREDWERRTSRHRQRWQESGEESVGVGVRSGVRRNV